MNQPKVNVAKATSGATKAAAAPMIEDESLLYTSPLSVEEKVAVAMSVGEETLTVEELTALYTAKPHPIVYDGFEPSGRMHIAQVSILIVRFNAIKTGRLIEDGLDVYHTIY